MVRSITQLTVAEIAKREGVSHRQAERYTSKGYNGIILPSIIADKRGKKLVEISDYRQWRIAVGFDKPAPAPSDGARPAESAERPPTTESGVRPKESLERPAKPKATYPPWPQAADPNGVLTNAPAPNSRNWPHPEACRIKNEELQRKLRNDYAEPED
jgi:hypothetical protein